MAQYQKPIRVALCATSDGQIKEWLEMGVEKFQSLLRELDEEPSS